MLTEQLYFPSNKILQQERFHAKNQCYQFNQLSPKESKQAKKLIKGLLSSVGFHYKFF